MLKQETASQVIDHAIALGADFVFLGRPWLYAASMGQTGLNQMYHALYDELDVAMAMCGVTSLKRRPSSKILSGQKQTG